MIEKIAESLLRQVPNIDFKLNPDEYFPLKDSIAEAIREAQIEVLANLMYDNALKADSDYINIHYVQKQTDKLKSEIDEVKK